MQYFFWNIFGTPNNVTKSGPSDPVFITNISQKKQEQVWEHPWNIWFSYLRIWISENCGRYVYLTLWLFMFLILKFWNMNMKFEIVNCEAFKLLDFPLVYWSRTPEFLVFSKTKSFQNQIVCHHAVFWMSLDPSGNITNRVPKTGSNRAQNTATKLSESVVFFVF